jgi:predicted AAA+ superfamily ATPase
MGQRNLVQLLESRDWELVKVFASRFSDLLKQYYFVGGMPEAVAAFAQTKNFAEVRRVHQALLDGYRRDFTKHAPAEVAPRISMVWNSIPGQLSRENKKFICKDVAPGLRMRDVEYALQWLVDAGLVHTVSRVSKPAFPPAAYRDRLFKLFFVDVGLLGAMADLQAKTIVEGNAIFTEFKGALAEQYVQQQLRAANTRELFYWSSRDSDCEIDFAFGCGAAFVPVEVKAEINLQAKSLMTFCRKQQVPLALRVSMSSFQISNPPAGKDGGTFSLVDLPLYGIEQAYKVCEAIQG